MRLHDVGKVGIPESILNKPGPLPDEERRVIRAHPVIAEETFASIKAGALRQSVEGIV